MLTPIRTPGQPQAFSTYDLEWYPESYELRLIGLDDGDHYREFGADMNAFLDAVLTPRYSGRVFFAHAGGLADVQFVLETLLKRLGTMSLQASFSGSSAIIVKVTDVDENEWFFCDSYWLLRDKLSTIGKSINLEKGGGEYVCPGVCVPPHNDKTDKPVLSCGHFYTHCIYYAPFGILRDYNALDCRILWKAIRRLEEELLELGGELKMTIAGSAMRLFRGHFLKRDIETNKRVNEIARGAYIASRVEVFKKELVGPAHVFDFNSSFPFSLTKPMPGRMFSHRTGKRAWKEGTDLSLVRARVRIPDCNIPPIPMRHEERVYFPTGEWEGWFSGVDLRYLIECGGRVEKVDESFLFEPFSDLADYVNIIYALRKNETDEFRRLVYKYLLNALYGKFAEEQLKECLYVNKDVPRHGALNVTPVFGLPNAHFFERKAKLVHEHVPISMVTTAYSREMLTRGLHAADAGKCAAPPGKMEEWWGLSPNPKEWSKSKKEMLSAMLAYESYERLAQTGKYDPSPAYCDTDSILTQAWLGHSPELGALKWEESIDAWDDAELVVPKLYRFGDKVRAKGFSPREGKKKLLREDFEVIASGAYWHMERMMRIKEVLKSEDLRPRGKVIDKHIALKERPKRCERADATTRPWSVGEIQSVWKGAA